MKTKIILMALTLLSLFSCAKDDEVRFGVMDCKVNLSMVMPDFAFFDVTIPDEKDNMLEWKSSSTQVFLMDRPLDSSQNFWDKFYNEARFSTKSYHNGKFSAENLKPNTTYYIVVIGSMEKFVAGEYYTGFSFTTAKQGDYSGLGEIRCEIVRRDMTGYTTIKVTLPSDIEFYNHYSSCLVVSTNPDMSNYITSKHVNANGPEWVFEFDNLPDGIYYLQLDGHFRTTFTSYRFNDECITLNAATTLNLTQ